MFIVFALEEKDVICLRDLFSITVLQINNYCVFVAGEYEALQIEYLIVFGELQHCHKSNSWLF